MNSMLDAEEEIMNLEDEYADGENNDDSKPSLNGTDSNEQLNSSSNSLDKYVGKGRNSKYMTLLPEDFEPGELDVLCGRGKRCFNSPGNQRFRKLVAARADDYSAASTRTDKTFIVCSIVSEIRKASPKGGFVKKDSATGRWYEVGDFNAHEKTSQMFRDVLHENYLSSNKSKKKRRDLFRTNSKRRALMQQQQAQKQTLNASSARFLRANGVARHHSYGSARVTAQQQASLMRMRQQARMGSEHSNPARADAWQNNSHSSWQNSWHSDAGLKSEPGIGMAGNPRALFAQRRQNSLGDLSGSIGELRVSDAPAQQFHSSMGDLRFNNDFGDFQAQDNFHNSFGEFNTNGLGLATANNDMYNSSAGDINTGAFHESFGGAADFHNSFGEYVNNDARARAMASRSPNMMMNMSEPRARTNPNMMYRRANSADFDYPGNAALAEPDYDTLDLQAPPSVPLSISVPSEHSSSGRVMNNIDREQFQLEFEPDENSLNRQRERRAMQNGLSIVDTLDTAGYSNPRSDDNPFEPVPVEELPDDILMETMF